MDQPQEHDFERDWTELKRASSVLFRYPKSILAVTLLITSFSWLFAVTRTPLFRGTATLKLEALRGARSPVLEGFDIPEGVTEVDEAVTLLVASSLAEQVILPPSDGAIATPDHPEWSRHLGLTTLVEDETLVPIKAQLAALRGWRSSDFRLYAFVDEAQPGAPDEVRLRFLDRQHVMVSRVSGKPGIEWPSDEPLALEFHEGEPFSVHGLTLRIATRGRWDGRTFRVRHLSPQDALQETVRKIRVSTVRDQKRLVRVSVDDSDPQRASAIANALCQSYLDDDLARTRERAQQDVEFVGRELALRQAELDRLETRIAQIQVRYPDAVDAKAAGVNLLARRLTLETQYQMLGSRVANLRRMVAALHRGDRSQVSRMGPDLDDLFTRKMLDQIAVFQDERRRVERHESGQFHDERKLLMEQKIGELKALEAHYLALDEVIARLERGDVSALGRLEGRGERTSAAQISVDEYTRQMIALLTRMRTELLELRTEYQSDARIVTDKEHNIQLVLRDILGHLKDGREFQRGMMRETVRYWEELVAKYPADERRLIDEALEDLWGRVEQSLESRLEGVTQKADSLALAIEGIETRIQTLPLASELLAEPLRLRSAKQSKVDQLLRDQDSAQIALAGVQPSAHFLDRALRPRRQLKPVGTFGAIVGLFAGLILSISGALVCHRLGGRLRSEPELEEATGLPVYGVIPAARPRRWPGQARSPWLALRDEPDGLAAEAYRSLRSRLRGLEAAGRPLRSLGVTSCLAGEGKTSTNAGLAMAFALEGRRVLLVDGHLRSPGVHEALGVEALPGLAEALDGRKHWLQCVQHTSHRNLFVLAAGDHYYSPGDMLGSEQMRRLLADAGREYDLVILDLPQVLGLPDVEAVARELDALLLLYSDASRPSRVLVGKVVRRLARSGANLAGIVHNAVPAEAGGERRRSWAAA